MIDERPTTILVVLALIGAAYVTWAVLRVLFAAIMLLVAPDAIGGCS